MKTITTLTLAGFENRFAKIESDLVLLKWMTGTAIVVILSGFGLIARLVLDVVANVGAS
jgi:hypothetical protein